jgi:hypothetical protein
MKVQIHQTNKGKEQKEATVLFFLALRVTSNNLQQRHALGH